MAAGHRSSCKTMVAPESSPQDGRVTGKQLNSLMPLVGIPTLLKFLVVSLIAIPVCFLLSVLIHKIPCAKRVLG